MAYYLVGFDKKIKHFQARLSFLAGAHLLDSPEACQNILQALPDSALFLIDFAGGRSEKDDLVLGLRESGRDIRVIYVVAPDSGDLKSHQQTPTGGDAYVPADIAQDQLQKIITTLGLGEREGVSGAAEAFELDVLKNFKEHPLSHELNHLFSLVIPEEEKPDWLNNTNTLTHDGADMSSNKDDELSLDDMGEFELTELSDPSDTSDSPEISLEDDSLDLSFSDSDEDDGLTLSESEAGEDLSLSDSDEVLENIGELDFGNLSDLSLDDAPSPSDAAQAEEPSAAFSLEPDEALSLDDGSLSFDEAPEQDHQDLAPEPQSDLGGAEESELSEEVKEKLKEIDAIMDGSSKINIRNPGDSFNLAADEPDQDLDKPLVSDDINVDELNFSADEPVEEKAAPAVKAETEKPKRKKKEVKDDSSDDIREISGAYTGELERMQATISNLRADRDELLAKIEHFEDEQVMHKRQTLSLRAELDEKKIELSIIRRKLNDEVSELKDRLRIHEEKRLILEERNKMLQQELEKAGHRSKLDVKKVQMRERELEQKLELLKADAETQIRNRDLKILELKRRIDSMEFDMESISTQEKKSVESKYELEDKLDKAIKTLRSAITVLEEEGRSSTLDALKKNIDI